MSKNYTREELNKILLNKKLEDFYLTIIENRQEILTDEEYKKIANGAKTIYGDNKEEVEDLFNRVQNDERLNGLQDEFMKLMYSFAQIRHVGVLTLVGDEVFNIGDNSFVNLKRNKIIKFDNLTTYFDDSNARIKIFTPQEEPQITEDSALLDIDDVSIIEAYEKSFIKQEESDDLTKDFFETIKGNPYIKR